jgi:gamma-glutamyltranspeptidase / glutathione hydrolase
MSDSPRQIPALGQDVDSPSHFRDGVRHQRREGIWEHQPDLQRLGYKTIHDPDTRGFGGGQAILVSEEALVGGSDPRKDGYASGF